METCYEMQQNFALEGKKNMDNWNQKWVFFLSALRKTVKLV